jgi:hypothetical protein
MTSPVYCRYCGEIYDLTKVTPIAHFADYDTYRTPCCNHQERFVGSKPLMVILRSNIAPGAAVSLLWHNYNAPSTRPMLKSFVMQFHLVSLNNEIRTGERWQIHKLNCRDIEKLIKRGDRADIISAESPEAFIEAELTNELSESGWTAEEFRIMPCCNEVG